jgi:hypothetical protein
MKYLLLLLLFLTKIKAGTYSEFRLDDFFTKEFGKIKIPTPLRSESISANSNPNKQFFTKTYLGTRFFSQKGGNPSDLSSRYGIQANSSIDILFKKENFSILFSPNLRFQREHHLVKQEKNTFEPELIFNYKYKFNSFETSIEFGRGFQRLDSYGFVFGGFSNFVELKNNFQKFSLSLLTLNYSRENSFLKKLGTENKLSGIELKSENFLFLKNINLFHYTFIQEKQIYERRVLENDLTFIPRADLKIYGLETETEKFFSLLQFDFGVFHSKGNLDFKNSILSTNQKKNLKGNLYYTTTKLFFDTHIFQIGGLLFTYTKKENEEQIYTPLLADARIFGGKSSFFLNETINSSFTPPFQTFDSPRIIQTNHKGIQMTSFGYLYELNRYMILNLYLNRAIIPEIMNGFEIITSLSSSLKSESNYFYLASFTKVFANITKTEKSFNEFQLESKKGEWIRFYLSLGIRF